MYNVHVFIKVKPEYRQEFIKATIENAASSIKEPGIARFDFLQDTENDHSFVLLEVYKTSQDALKHKETEHYQRWRDSVQEMMAVPRTRMILSNIVPEDKGKGKK
jgi:quinol monooxygenase YgiN